MPRPRLLEAPQRQSPRGPPNTKASEVPKKLGTRIANLESQLELAQEELRSVKDEFDKKRSVVITYETADVLEVRESGLLEEETKADIVDKEKQVEVLRRQLDERGGEVEELKVRLGEMSEELEESKSRVLEKDEKLGLSEKARVELEKEMNGVRLQSEQWKKAADAAASALAEMTGQRLLSDRCGSMDKVYTTSFEGVGRYVGLGDDVFGGDNRKSRMLGDWWKKKAQK